MIRSAHITGGVAERPALIVLAHSRDRPSRILRIAESAGGPIRWLFLAEDYPRLLDWQAAFDGHAVRVPQGDAIARAAGELKVPFLDLMTELGRRHESIPWWVSQLSERNTLVSPLFLHCCYLKVATDELGTTETTLCVISDSQAVLRSLAGIARTRSASVRSTARASYSVGFAIHPIRRAKRIGSFLASGAYRGVAAPPVSRPGGSAGKRILIRTWIDKGSFDAGGSFRDPYLPGLAEWLGVRGLDVFTVPVLTFAGRSYRVAARALRDSGSRALLPESYYRPSDYVWALTQARRAAALPRDPVQVGSLGVGRLFEAERLRGAYDRRTLEALLFYRLPGRLAQAGLDAEVLIQEFENMISDKGLTMGCRRFLPATKLVGFQHGSISPLLLCTFVTRGEAEFAPLPDRVVCNGEHFKEVLVEAGLPPDRAVVGPALRYRHLRDVEKTSSSAPGSALIFVPLPMVQSIAAELLHKTLGALESHTGVRVELKPHPMSSPEVVMRAARLKRLPPHFAFVDGRMGELLARARVTVATASSAVHEALAAGVPVVVVGREAGLDLNPLAWEPGFDRVFREPEAIEREVLRLLALSGAELGEYRERAAEVLRKSFNAVSDKSMRAFVDGFVELPGEALTAPGSR